MYNTDLPTRAELPSARQLIRSTVIALATAGAVLVVAVMPAEYGIDVTGVGRLLGLTPMGEIKTALAREAEKEAVAAVAAAAKAGTQSAAAAAPAVAAPSAPAAAPPQAGQTHRTVVTLKPGQAAEVKLDMRKGAKVVYRWTAEGGRVNFDAHGDPPKPPAGFYHGYGKGRQVERDEGTLEAAFDGQHGWYWRNRSAAEVTVTLNTQGAYAAIKRVL